MPDWTQVADGIEYRQYTLPDPNNIFVTRMDRGNLNVTLESCIAQGKLVSGKETVSAMAAPQTRTTATPNGRRFSRPSRMPARCSRPVAMTNPSP